MALKEDIETKGIAPHHIALLYRANPQSRLFEGSLKHHSIPYKIVGGTSFFDTKEVKNLLAWLALIDNPRNELAFRRMVNFPARGIGNKSLEKIIEGAQHHKASLLHYGEQGAPQQELKSGHAAKPHCVRKAPVHCRTTRQKGTSKGNGCDL